MRRADASAPGRPAAKIGAPQCGLDDCVRCVGAVAVSTRSAAKGVESDAPGGWRRSQPHGHAVSGVEGGDVPGQRVLVAAARDLDDVEPDAQSAGRDALQEDAHALQMAFVAGLGVVDEQQRLWWARRRRRR